MIERSRALRKEAPGPTTPLEARRHQMFLYWERDVPTETNFFNLAKLFAHEASTQPLPQEKSRV